MGVESKRRCLEYTRERGGEEEEERERERERAFVGKKSLNDLINFSNSVVQS